MAKTSSKNSQKVLLPTLKEEKRYIVYHVVFSESQGERFGKVHDELLRECSRTLGLFDGAKAGLQGVKFDSTTSRGIIRCESGYVTRLKVCLGLVKSLRIDGKEIPMTLDVDFVSGVLGKAAERMSQK